MSKKEKLKPEVLFTREAMEAAVNDFARLKLKHVSLTAEMEADKAWVEKRFQERIAASLREIELKFAAVQNYCCTHRGELFPTEKKSFETVSATVRFYDTPPRVGKRGKDTLGAIALRLLGLVFDPKGGERIECDKYVREPAPELNKEMLLQDRKRFTDEQLKAMGLRFESDEIFAIEPKSQLAEAETAPVEERQAA